MQRILIAVEDPALADQIRTGMKQFRNLQGVRVPRTEVLRLVLDPEVAQGVILDHQKEAGGKDAMIQEVRRLNSDIHIMAVAHRPERDQFNKLKVELNVFSFIPLPLEPFDLARRLHRLSNALAPVL